MTRSLVRTARFAKQGIERVGREVGSKGGHENRKQNQVWQQQCANNTAGQAGKSEPGLLKNVIKK